MTTKEQTFNLNDIDLALAQKSFLSFLGHVRILPVAVGGTQGGLIPLELLRRRCLNDD
jgi:hypothetical protein